MSTQSIDGVVSLSFRPGTVSHLQITTDPTTGPLPLRVMLALPTGPWIQNGGGGGASDFTGASATGLPPTRSRQSTSRPAAV